MNTEKFEGMSWIPFGLSVRIAGCLSRLQYLPRELECKQPIKVNKFHGFYVITFLMDDSGHHRQDYTIDPVLLEKGVFTKKLDVVEFISLMNEALFLEEAKMDKIRKSKGLKDDNVPHFTIEDDEE